MDFFGWFDKYFIHHTFGYAYILSIIFLVLQICGVLNSYRLSFHPNGKGNSFFTWKSKDEKWLNYQVLLLCLADIASTFLVTVFVFCFWEFLLGSHNYINYISWPLVILFHVFVFTKLPWFERIAKAACLTTIVFIEPALNLTVVTPIAQGSQKAFPIVSSIFLALLCFLTTFALRHYRMDKFEPSNYLCLWLLVLIMAVSICVTCIPRYSDGGENQPNDYSFQPFEFTLYLGLIIMSLSTYYLYYRTLFEHQSSLENQAMLIKTQNDVELMNLSKQNMEELKTVRHDLKNQYQYMKILVDNKEYDKLNTFFSDMAETAFVPLSFADTGNTAVTSILNMEINKARKMNIKIDHSIAVPKSMNISDYHLCSLLTNIIDNALEGCDKAEGVEKVVNIKMTYEKPYLRILVSNPTRLKSVPTQRELPTSKKDKGVHGYGTKIIDAIVRQYDGVVKYEVKSGQFVSSCLLMEKEGKEDE